MSKNISKIFNGVITLVLLISLIGAGFWVHRWLEEGRILRQVIERLSAESRIAEVLVTKSEFDETTQRVLTTIKFLEYDAHGKPQKPKYFSFQGNIIQFQALVIRFQDDFVKAGDKLKGKSAYIFLKAFMLDGHETQEFVITQTDQVPEGYQVSETLHLYEEKLWKDFWNYALDPKSRERSGIKNAQIEAPGTMFLPGTIYTVHIEHDGGLRIDSRPVPDILKGEMI